MIASYFYDERFYIIFNWFLLKVFRPASLNFFRYSKWFAVVSFFMYCFCRPAAGPRLKGRKSQVNDGRTQNTLSAKNKSRKRGKSGAPFFSLDTSGRSTLGTSGAGTVGSRAGRSTRGGQNSNQPIAMMNPKMRRLDSHVRDQVRKLWFFCNCMLIVAASLSTDLPFRLEEDCRQAFFKSILLLWILKQELKRTRDKI